MPQPTWATTSARELIRRKYFPEITLTDQSGERLRLYEDLIRDRIVVLNFFYATCKGICVPVTANLVRVQRLLGARMGSTIFMCSFTLEPEDDTPEVLRDYAAMHKVGPGWRFLTGAPRYLETLRKSLGFTDPDPAVDAVRTSHTGMLRFGNEPLTLWSGCPGMMKPEALARTILDLDPSAPRR